MAARKYVDIVFRVIQELNDLHGGGPAKRDEIVAATGFKKSLVDECVKDLLEDFETIIKLRSGFYAPKPVFDESPCTVSQLDDGRVKMENGDSMMVVTPLAARTFAKMLAGYLMLMGRA